MWARSLSPYHDYISLASVFLEICNLQFAICCHIAHTHRSRRLLKMCSVLNDLHQVCCCCCSVFWVLVSTPSNRWLTTAATATNVQQKQQIYKKKKQTTKTIFMPMATTAEPHTDTEIHKSTRIHNKYWAEEGGLAFEVGAGGRRSLTLCQ